MQIEAYPINLVPQTNWRREIKADDLLEQVEDFCVIRRIDGNQEDCIDDVLGLPFIKNNVLKTNDAINMSVSLLGALFLANHICFRQVGEGCAPWAGEQVEAETLVATHVEEIKQPHFGVIWFASQIHNKAVPYKKEFNKVSEYKDFKEKVQFVSGIILEEFESYKNTENPLQAMTRLNHRPTKLNYWHFTFDTYPADSREPLMKSGSWRTRLLEKITKDILRFSFKLYEDCEVPTIPEQVWQVI